MGTRSIFWFGVLAIAFIAVAEAQLDESPVDILYKECACKYKKKSISSLFCSSDFVIVGKVDYGISLMANGKYYTRYTVDILTWYKWVYCLNEMYIFTPIDCDIEPPPVYGVKYVFMGKGWHGYMLVDGCDWYAKWSDMTSFQRNAIKKGIYEKRCPCVKPLQWEAVQIQELQSDTLPHQKGK